MISILLNNNESDLIFFEGELSVSSAMNGTTLNKISKIIDKKNVIKIIAYLTTRLSENFNVGKKFTTEQATIMAFDLFEIFGFETIEDIVLMFKMARQGKIGDGKDFKLDSQTVFHKWIPEYLELKAEQREKEHQDNKKKINQSENQLTLQDVRNAYKKANPQKQHDLLIEKINSITKYFDRQMLEDLIITWTKDKDISKDELRLLIMKRKVILK